MQSGQQTVTNGRVEADEVIFRYLDYLFQRTGGDPSREVPVKETIRALGVTEDEGERTSGFLRRKAFTAGTYDHDCLTTAGMDEHKRLLAPANATDSGNVHYHYGNHYDTSISGNVSGSNVMVGSDGSTQQQISIEAVPTKDALRAIVEAVQSVRDALPQLPLDEQQREAAEVNLAELEKETTAQTPDRKKLRVYVNSLMFVLQSMALNAAGNVIAQPLIHTLQLVLPVLMGKTA